MSKVSDALVTEEDFQTIAVAIDRGHFKRLVCEMITREPEIALCISERFDSMLMLVTAIDITHKQRERLIREITFLTWSPAIALERAHRRAWEQFLPSTATAGDEDNDAPEGGAA